ncbi:MAG: bifunctional phosphopantothenoylcysteine decarboxylase/phosphopantothenate--cysteine ligase CoaBC [Halanaerobiaceae bacterium]
MKKNILLGITGGIAAYKMIEVARKLTKLGCSVHTVMTEAGTEFVTPMTFESITHNPVETELFTPPVHYNIKHISLAEKADLCLVAPATANFIGKIAGGIADDLLSTIIMATRAPVIFSPSMNVNMYNNQILQDNIGYIKSKGYKIIEPAEGDLACGDSGKGRLPEPEELIENVLLELKPSDLKDKSVLITAGPTREYIDPIRFLSNSSSGKMGYALAREAALHGAEVTLISGPTNITPPSTVKTFCYVESTEEMLLKVKEHLNDSDIIIMNAAVSDFRPLELQENKIKKDERDSLILKLAPNPDILTEIGHIKKKSQKLIGFAAESYNLVENAEKKLIKKNLDMIIANHIDAFSADWNEIIIMTGEDREEISRQEKTELAGIIIDRINTALL